jgi:hypothetical protein
MASKNGSRPSTCTLTDLLQRIVAECPEPARLLELYYWSVEPELAEVMRQYMAAPEQFRAALHAFLVLAANDPAAITHRLTPEGDLILSSPTTTQVARNLADATGERPLVVH